MKHDRHHTITAAANLRTIARLYPDLETALGTKEQHNNAGYITGSKPGSTLPLNVKASEVKGEIDLWAAAECGVIEPDCPPEQWLTPGDNPHREQETP